MKRASSPAPALWVASGVRAIAWALAAACLPLPAPAADHAYPETRRSDVVDLYFGQVVPDPYRWLEESDSPEVASWTESQNAFTRKYLDKTGTVDAIRERLSALTDYRRYGMPIEEHGVVIYGMNEGLQNQSVQYVRNGVDGTPRLLLDPNTLSEDGTASIRSWSVSPDARHVAYGISLSGSDWQELRVIDVETGRDLPDRFPDVKFTEAAWSIDSKGFYYTRQPARGSVPEGDEHYFPKLRYHRLGDDPALDELLYERPEMKEAGISPEVTSDGRNLVVTVSAGSSARNEVFVMPLLGKDRTFRPLFTGFDASYRFVGSDGDLFYFSTDREAPKRRIVGVSPAKQGEPTLETILPEGRDAIVQASIVNGELWVETLHNAHSRLVIHDLRGGVVREIRLPDLGSVSFKGRPDSGIVFVSFSSFLYPASIYRYDYTSHELVPYFEAAIDFDRDAYVARQVWYESGDGTLVPMFLVHRRNLVLDGNNPTLLYGYGGFNISMTPSFSATNLFWLDQGGIYAVANLRGGGEFGKEWHEAGMLDRKQNVFDDFIAAAHYLIAHGYTRTELLAIKGGSNGGLLTSAVEMQRPDLFGAVIVQVPVADMLRYHLFTVARFWIPEYGSSETSAQFKFLRAYSPLHNVGPGVAYPATLILTGESDDRVHPGQARKLAATMQAESGSSEPVLIRVETRAGHGGGKPIYKTLDESADMYAFLLHELGMKLEGSGGKDKQRRPGSSARR